MNLRSPLDDLLPGTRGQVVSAIAQLAHPVTVRTLAKHAGVSPQTALDTVNDLSDVGLIHAARAGQSLLVTLNRDHLLADPLRAMVETRGRLLSRLTDHRAGWRHLSAAWLFGSAARGDGGRHSDTDLLVVADRGLVTDEWTTAVTDLHSAVETWAGNRLQLVEHTRASLAALVGSQNPLVEAIRRDGLPLKPGSRRLCDNHDAPPRRSECCLRYHRRPGQAPRRRRLP